MVLTHMRAPCVGDYSAKLRNWTGSIGTLPVDHVSTLSITYVALHPCFLPYPKSDTV